MGRAQENRKGWSVWKAPLKTWATSPWWLIFYRCHRGKFCRLLTSEFCRYLWVSYRASENKILGCARWTDSVREWLHLQWEGEIYALCNWTGECQTGFHWHFWRLTTPSWCSQCISVVQQHQENFSVQPMWLMLSLSTPVNHIDSSLLINTTSIITSSLILQSHRVISANITSFF